MNHIIFIAKGCPNLIKSAGDIRALNLLRLLREKYDVSVISNSADYGEGDVKSIGCQSFLTGNVAGIIKQLVNEKPTNLIIISHWSIAATYLDSIRQVTNAKIIIDTIDIEFLRLQRKHDLVGEEKYAQWCVDNVKEKELAIYHRADALIVTAEQDKTELDKHASFNIIQYPCIFEVNQSEIELNTKKTYTICNWIHEPNVLATVWLLEKVIPYVDVEFYTVGKHVPESVAKFGSEKVIIHGAEYEIKKFLRDKSICLAEVLWGAGMNGKVGEALGYGIPVVTTDYGANPYGLTHGENVMIAHNEHEFIEHVKNLLVDKDLRSKLSKNGKILIREKYTNDCWRKSTHDFIHTIGA